MTLGEVLVAVWQQTLADNLPTVEVAGGRYTVGKTRSAGLRIVAFRYEGRTIEAIEQNPEKTSRWAELARAGKLVMQFSVSHRYVANVCDGTLTRYPAWKSLQLPE